MGEREGVQMVRTGSYEGQSEEFVDCRMPRARSRKAQGAQVRDGSGDFDSSYRRPHQAPAPSMGAALDSLKTSISNHFYNLSTATTDENAKFSLHKDIADLCSTYSFPLTARSAYAEPRWQKRNSTRATVGLARSI